MRIDCLDHGFVELVDIMGSDERILQAARTSTQKSSKSAEQDRELMRYLMRNQHTSPFEFVEILFDVKLPIFVARQWIRHRTASVNEVSGRYSILKTEFYTPEKERIKGKGKINKQSSEGEVSEIEKDTWLESLERHYQDESDLYDMGNSFGISNELTRINLPVSTYTQWYWKIDLHNLFHFLKLRLSQHAQYEIRVYAEAMFKLLKEKVPIACEAFEDYVLESKIFSKHEMQVLKKILKENYFNYSESCGLSQNEFYAFLNKLS